MQTINFADMTQPKYDIFISYRRVGGYETAKHLFDLLSRDGYKVSFDIDTLRNGDFDVELLKRVEECTDFILILNQGAFDRTIDPDFDPQKDWLRQELAHALKLGKNIIPIMLNGFTEFPDNLPADVARVQKKNGPKYDQYYFDEFYNKLVNIFLETPKPVKSTVQVATSKPTMGTLIIKTDLDCAVYNYGEKIGEAKAGEYTSFTLPLGDNELMYVGLECNEDYYEEPQPIVIEENRRTSVKVALLEKYNTRTYLLSLPDEEFERFKNGKYGFKLKSSGKIVIEPKYDNAIYAFSEGLAMVELNGKWGFINKTGKEVTPFKYDYYAMSFSEGLAMVWLNGKWGFIDKTGKEVISLKYDDACDVSEGLAAVKLNGKWGFIDKTGKEIVPLKYDVTGYFSEGLARVKLNGKWGYIDKTGKEVVPLKYDDVHSFSEGLAKVELNGKWGFIDKTGKEIVPLKYDSAAYLHFSEGKAKAERDAYLLSFPDNQFEEFEENGKCGYKIKSTGEIVVSPKYSFAGYFWEGLAWVVSDYFPYKFGFIDKTGEEVIPLKYDRGGNFSEGLAMVEINRKYGFIDRTGEEVIPLKYDYAGDFSEGLAWVGLNGKYGYIDKTGKEVIPLKYDKVDYFSEGLAAVKLNGKWGFIDKTGKEITPLKYDLADSFSGGKVQVKLNGETFYIDKNGNRV